MKEILLTDWHFMRWLRLALGIYIGIQAAVMHHPISGFIAAFFLFQAITNTGCCGTGTCNTPINQKSARKIEETEFEEIK